ncbi:CRISPR-associated endonuclease Cas2 [Paenibacillus taiwanensis]|uniref:CRISPR-associated endonuclease Cas2 n=1 Tax=Paenibacillus taiwanensis TaxID=401638 RepID=UPI00048EDF55|nr:CRISPR-associated endonuclease Cas2 [Paenibacillus taiwanensis]
MLVLITYDVKTTSSAGQRRLRKVSKMCQNYGHRVQNSVFECNVDAAQLVSLKLQLLEMIDPKEDSLRFYQLGNHYKNKVEHVGVKPSIDMDAPLIL